MLTDREAFVRQLQDLARFHAKELDEPTIRTYWDTLSPRLDDEAFAGACEVLKTGEWWPTPARILRASETVNCFAQHSAVAALYGRVRGCDEFGPTGGSTYRLETVDRRCGEVAARLVRAVGGAYAFERALLQPEDEPFLRKAFLEAAQDLARAEPETMRALIAQHEGRELPASRAALPPGREESPSGPARIAGAVERITQRVLRDAP